MGIQRRCLDDDTDSMNPPLPVTDATAFYRGLVNLYLDEMRRQALRLTRCRADAEDLLQDVLIRLYVHRHRLPHVKQLRPWLYRVVRHRYIDRRRRAAAAVRFRERSAPAGENLQRAAGEAVPLASYEPLTAPERHAFEAQLRPLAGRLLDSLATAQRTVVSLHVLEELPLPEIAARLNLPLNSLKSSLARAYAALRERLDAGTVSAELPARRLGACRPQLRPTVSGCRGARRRAKRPSRPPLPSASSATRRTDTGPA